MTLNLLFNIQKEISALDKGLAYSEKQLHQDAADLLIQSTLSFFQAETDPLTGIPWIPSKSAIREGRKTLQDTLRLINSFEAEANTSSVTVINDTPYATDVINGTNKGGIPRNFMGYSSDTLDQIGDRLADNIENQLKGLFG